MRKVIDFLKKYFVIGLVLSSIFVAWNISSAVRNNTLQNVDLLYIIKNVLGTLVMAVILVPPIAFVDCFIVRATISLFKDFKYADRSGRILIVVVSIGLFMKIIKGYIIIVQYKKI